MCHHIQHSLSLENTNLYRASSRSGVSFPYIALRDTHYEQHSLVAHASPPFSTYTRGSHVCMGLHSGFWTPSMASWTFAKNLQRAELSTGE